MHLLNSRQLACAYESNQLAGTPISQSAHVPKMTFASPLSSVRLGEAFPTIKAPVCKVQIQLMAHL